MEASSNRDPPRSVIQEESCYGSGKTSRFLMAVKSFLLNDRTGSQFTLWKTYRSECRRVRFRIATVAIAAITSIASQSGQRLREDWAGS